MWPARPPRLERGVTEDLLHVERAYEDESEEAGAKKKADGVGSGDGLDRNRRRGRRGASTRVSTIKNATRRTAEPASMARVRCFPSPPGAPGRRRRPRAPGRR